MTSTSRLLSARSLGRAGAELALIVMGILLALWIDGRVEAAKEAELERHYLTLLSRDLQATIDDLDRLALVYGRAREFAIETYRMLHLPPDRIEGDRLATLLRAVGIRLTPRLRKAAYTTLLSSGELHLIRDRVLRDELVRFYEEADRLFTVLDKNATNAVDEGISRLLWSEGLVGVTVQPDLDPSAGLLVNDAAVDFLAALGPEFEPAPHRLLQLPPDAPEWAQVQGSVYRTYQNATNTFQVSALLRARAVELRQKVDSALGSDPGVERPEAT